MATMSVSGVASGMDWESMIDTLIEKAQQPAMVKVNKRTDLVNKKSLFEEMKVMVNSMQSSMSSLKLPSTYKAKEVEVERIDKSGSSKGVLTATVNADAEVNVYDLEVVQLAKAQTNRSYQINGSSINSYLGGNDSTLVITAGGQTVEIDAYTTDSLQTLASRINNTVKTLSVPMALTASVVDNKLIIKSDETGLGAVAVSATVKGGYSSSGVTSLTGLITDADSGATVDISVTEDNIDNLKVKSGGTTYKNGTDFVIVNGNEIRWKQYDESEHVKLGESVDMIYTMAAGDVYTKTITRGDEDVDTLGLGFDVIDKGTLAKRFTIVDEDGETYIYGRDFKLNDEGNIEWIAEAEDPEDPTDEPAEETRKTYEPDSYTVSVAKDTSVSFSMKGAELDSSGEITSEPDTYTVSYEVAAEGASVNGTKSKGVDIPEAFTVSYTLFSSDVKRAAIHYDTISNANEASPKVTYSQLLEAGIPMHECEYSSGNYRYYVDEKNNPYLSITASDSNGTYQYDADFFIISDSYTTQGGTPNSEKLSLSWKKESSNWPGDYVDMSDRANSKSPTAGNAYSLSFSYAADSTSAKYSDYLAKVIEASNGDYENISITGSDGKTYKYGEDFYIDNGDVTWYNTSSDTDESLADISAIQNAYKTATGSDLPTVTLTDGNGNIYTYIDPEDTSIFTMEADDGTTYQYGRDYVLRVDDAGTGYAVSWLITSDTNGDGELNLKDANTIVSTYTAYKNISLSDFKAAPGADSSYMLTYTPAEETRTVSAEVNYNDSNKNIFDLLGIDITEPYFGDVKISSGGKNYEYTYYDWDTDADFTITSDGDISWIKRDFENETLDIDELAQAYYDITGENLTAVTFSDSSGTLHTVIDPADNWLTYTDADGNTKNLFSMTAGDTEYQYGRDYVIAVNSSGDGYEFIWALDEDTNGDGQITTSDANVLVSAYTAYKGLNTYNLQQAPGKGYGYEFSIDYQRTTDYSSSEISADDEEKDLTVSKLITSVDISEDDYENITITDADGNVYTYGKHFTINDDGEIEWLKRMKTVSYEPDDYSVEFYIASSEGNVTYSAVKSSSTYSEDLANVIAIAEEWGNVPAISIYATDADGNEISFYYVDSEEDLSAESFTIDADGNIVFYTEEVDPDEEIDDDDDSGDDNDDTITPSRPAEGKTYTVTYTSLSAIEATATYTAGSNSTAVTFSVDNGEGRISGTGLSYEQMIYDLGFSTSTANAALSYPENMDEYFMDCFTLTDSTGKTYEYGTDYRITAGTEDSTTSQHSPVITWLSSNRPTNGTSFTVSYTGRGEGGETLSIENAVTRSDIDEILSTSANISPLYSYFEGGKVTITQNGKTFYEGEDLDFTIEKDANGNALVKWTGNFDWYMPSSGANSPYTINLTQADGSTKTFRAYRDSQDTINMSDLSDFGLGNFSTANGSVKVRYGEGEYIDPDSEAVYGDDDVLTTASGRDRLQSEYSISVDKTTQGGVNRVFNVNWLTPTRTTREGMPAYGDELTIEYEYDENKFSLSGDAADLLGLNEDVTEAQNAILILDGEELERESNDIGESYDNELIKGMTLHLKGVGQVSLDVSQDAQKAVEGIQTLVDAYNDLISWINTRMTEKQVDKTTEATIDSDDFRMRWGLLHGNSLLRNTKSQMRSLITNNFTYSFTQRTSSEPVYGAMSMNGLRATSTLRMRIGTKYVDLSISPTDTLQDIVDMISDSSNAAMRNIYYGDDGRLLDQPLIKASISDNKLVISSTSDEAITLSGSAAMNALKVNYTYKGLYQLGISTTSDDYGKSGEIEFDTDTFMEALEDNPDEVQELMLMFANNMDSWLKSMLTTSASGETSGTLTRQIEDLDTEIASIDDYLEDYQDRLDRMEENLRTKYANAETQFAKLSQQASAISSILTQLNNYSSSNSSSSSS